MSGINHFIERDLSYFTGQPLSIQFDEPIPLDWINQRLTAAYHQKQRENPGFEYGKRCYSIVINDLDRGLYTINRIPDVWKEHRQMDSTTSFTLKCCVLGRTPNELFGNNPIYKLSESEVLECVTGSVDQICAKEIQRIAATPIFGVCEMSGVDVGPQQYTVGQIVGATEIAVGWMRYQVVQEIVPDPARPNHFFVNIGEKMNSTFEEWAARVAGVLGPQSRDASAE